MRILRAKTRVKGHNPVRAHYPGALMQGTIMGGLEEAIQGALDKDGLRTAFLEFTRKAYSVVRGAAQPRILDIGCGTGIPTVELAKMSNGTVTGIDIDEKAIEKLTDRIDKEHLSHQIKPLRCSLLDLDFPDGSFDIIWVEGAISAVGFREGLKRWRRFLKPEGYLVIHDDEEGAERKRSTISECGFTLIKEFSIPSDTWRDRYYIPLMERIDELSLTYGKNEEAKRILRKERDDAQRYGNTPHGSIFFITQRTEGSQKWRS